MKKNLLLFTACALFSGLVITSCKKDAKEPTTDNSQVELATHSNDQSRVDAEMDAAANDADIALESNISFAGRFEGTAGLIADAQIAVNADSDPMTITISYDGTTTTGIRTRTGVVKLSMAKGSQWKTAGTVVTVNYQQLKITRTADNKSIILNGTQTYTNVSGGLLLNLVSLGTITHTINSAGLSVTFDDGTQRTWQVAKKRIFSFQNGVVITTTGTHTEGAVTGVAEWGTNRFGGNFTTAVTTPLVVRQDCSFRLTSGAISHVVPGFTADVVFGLNATGNAVSCPVGNYFYSLSWTGRAGNTFKLILPY